MAATVTPKVGRWRPGWPGPGLCTPAEFHTPHLEPHFLREPGDQNLCFPTVRVSKQVYSSPRQTRVWRFLTFRTKQKKRKQREPPPQTQEGQRTFPRQMCSGRGAGAFAVAARLQSLENNPLGAPVRGPEPPRHWPQQWGGWGSPGPAQLPTLCPVGSRAR